MSRSLAPFAVASSLAALTIAVLLSAPAAARAAPPGGSKPGGPVDLTIRRPPTVMSPHGPGDTDCAACHTAEGWRPVQFAHERTGFPLEGRHRDVTCKGCHTGSTFKDPVPRACSACHRDVHLGRLGPRCNDCHDPTSWTAPSFGPDAHRRTLFPLTGRHAATPCEDCHGDRRDRGFNRPTPKCIGCHQADFTRAAGAAVDHATPGFSTQCRSCHSTWSFAPATFPAHQTCFDIRHGPHAGVKCLGCHTTIPAVDVSQPLTCASDTADCIQCHQNAPAQHKDVLGFAMVNRKCYECHRFAPAP